MSEVSDDHDPRLPAGCFDTTKEGKIVVLLAGLKGFVECEGEPMATAVSLNEDAGVTDVQLKAMRIGAIHGFTHPASYVEWWEQKTKSEMRRVEHQLAERDSDG